MNASDIFKYGDLTMLGTLEQVPQTEWETAGVCGWWSVKDIVAHLASYEVLLVDVLYGFCGGDRPTLTLTAFLQAHVAFNDDQVAQRAKQTPAQTLAEYSAAHAEVMKLVAQISAETLRQPGTLPWYGLEYSLDDYFVYQYYGHKREHMAQVNVFWDTRKQSVSQTETRA